MMWEACAQVASWGAKFRSGRGRDGLILRCRQGLWTIEALTAKGSREVHQARARHLVGADRELASLSPAPGVAQPRGRRLRYRDFLTVVLILKRPDLFLRQLDLHPRSRREGRPRAELQIVVAGDGARPGMAVYGLEYFCFEGDGLWTSTTPN